MKKTIILLFFVFASFITVNAQELISREQFQKLIGFLNDENWPEAAKLSNDLLLKIPGKQQDDDAPAIVRYMYVTSEAGLMYMGKITKDEGLKNLVGFVGHTIILPSRTVSLKFGLNYIVNSDNKTDTLSISGTNRKGTDLFTFESIVPAKPITMDEFKGYEGKLFRIGGRLKSITVHGSMLPHFIMLIDNAILEPGDKL
jgi:hypothetical protein